MSICVHAFDIETSSPRLGPQKLMSIGATCLTISKCGEQKTTYSFSAVINWENGLIFDHKKTKQFWDHNLEAYKMNTKDGKSPHDVARMLKDHISNIQRDAYEQNVKYIVLTDNSYYDVVWLDWFLSTYSKDGLPLRINYWTGWMTSNQMVNLEERLQALKEINCFVDWSSFKATVKHDHTPLNDAIFLAEKYAYYRQFLRSNYH